MSYGPLLRPGDDFLAEILVKYDDHIPQGQRYELVYHDELGDVPASFSNHNNQEPTMNRNIVITYNNLDPKAFDDVLAALIWTNEMNITISDCDDDTLTTSTDLVEPWYVEAKRLSDKASQVRKPLEEIAEPWIALAKQHNDEEHDPRTPAGQAIVGNFACDFCSSKKGTPCVTATGKSAQFTHGARIAKAYGVSAV